MIYYLTIQGKFLGVEVFVNEYRLYNQSKDLHNEAMLLSPWLSVGQNVLRVKIYKSFAREQNASEAYSNVSLKVSISEVAEEEKQVASYVWSAHHGSHGAGQAQGVHSSPSLIDTNDLPEVQDGLIFEVPSDYELPPAPWEEATVQLTSLDSAYKLFSRIYNAFLSKDLSKIIELSKHKIEYGAKVANVDFDTFNEECVQDYRAFIESGLLLKEYNSPQDELMFHMFKDGTVFRALDINGAMPLRTVPDLNSIQTGYDLVFAVKGSELVWLM